MSAGDAFALAALLPVALYAAYVVKCRLGIDLLPQGGLHLPGPRSLLRRLLARARRRTV